ncbi:MAG: altronate dehydratase family protein, partial [Lachnospiraceae bacterium]|nr:altronate dehydratase family protein [Lachnospiraceae bacterium]
MQVIKIHPSDNVVVCLEDVAAGAAITVDGQEIVTKEAVGRGHKIAIREIKDGEPVVKYGNTIAYATTDIETGCWVHTHNVKTGLKEGGEYTYDHKVYDLPQVAPRTFKGFRRKDGRAAIRNEIWIVPIVGCVNGIAKQIVEESQDVVKGSVEGVYYWPHP